MGQQSFGEWAMLAISVKGNLAMFGCINYKNITRRLYLC